MKRWAWIAIFFAAAQTACSFGDTGDYVSYAVWNRSTEQGIEDCIVRSAGTPPEFLASCSIIDPLPRGAPGWGFGGGMTTADRGHLIPERVTVAWRRPPRTGQETYKGDLVGPFLVDLNAAIPADVRKQVRGSRRFQLEIAFALGLEPVTVRWRLLEWSDGMKDHREVRRGGDWN